MAHHPLRRQAPGAAELHRASVEVDSAQARIARSGSAAKALRQGTLQRSSRPARNEIRRRAVLKGPGLSPATCGSTICPSYARSLKCDLHATNRSRKLDSNLDAMQLQDHPFF